MDCNQCKDKLDPISNQASVSFSYNLGTTIPNTNKNLTNEVLTDIVCIYIKKSSNKYEVTIGETITYFINIINNGTVDVMNLFFIDTISDGTTFIENSFVVLGYSHLPGANPNHGVDLSQVIEILKPGQSITLSFDVLVGTICCPRNFTNTAQVNFEYNEEGGR